ncbi:MAG: carboxylesterase [Oceanospirillaceae bacterium]|nr:carboxylesterase [Oceanospirillaceae bacterium]|tara:strand:- start:325 stop:1029 length:705 start_codon:yes stop_codon:yes gene_type:complete
MNLIEIPEQVTIEPERTADACLIWLHGLGADGYDFVSLMPHIGKRTDIRSLRCIFPHAPVRPVTFSGGMEMRSWYDIYASSPKRQVSQEQLLGSVSRILSIIQQQIDSGIESHRILLAGFSQGGAVAYQTAADCPHALGGLICLSTYIAELPTHSLSFQPANEALSIMIGHGTRDAVVPISLGDNARHQLEQLGFTPEWQSYPIQHEVCFEEADDVAAFIHRRINIAHPTPQPR